MKTPRDRREMWLLAALPVGGAIILTVAIRVEILSYQAGVSLPYTDKGHYHQKWRAAADKAMVAAVKHDIAVRRMNAHVHERPEAPCPSEEEVMAAPFSTEEQDLFDCQMRRHFATRSLQNWLSAMGLLQYFLAPGVLVLSVFAIFFVRTRRVRIVGVLTLCVSVACSAAMFYRGYFTSLGLFD